MTMNKPTSLLILSLALIGGMAGNTVRAESEAPAATNAAPTTSPVYSPDSIRMEQDLQGLRWEQFRSIIESVPKMKADVDAYGPLGWQYVKGNYATYGWRKNIERLDDNQKQLLTELIRQARGSR